MLLAYNKDLLKKFGVPNGLQALSLQAEQMRSAMDRQKAAREAIALGAPGGQPAGQ